MLYVIVALTIGYLAFLLWEKRTNDKALASFRYVIHVNGIRGKTSVCRLIDAHLRGAGYRVFTKTTGSTPCWIGTDGIEHEIRRLGNANIGEQLSIIRKAYREKAEVLIIECMAVQPELQQVAQYALVKGNMNVITNVRYDHIFEMGESLEEIAEALSGTIPKNGVLFTADEVFYPYFCEKADALNTEVILCKPEDCNENEAIACALGEKLGVPAGSFREHTSNYIEDFGAQKMYHLENGRFLNLFSVNDPQSTRKVLDVHIPEASDVTFLYNNRADRPDRLLLFLRYFFPETHCRKIIVMGEARGLALRLLKKHGYTKTTEAKNWKHALSLSGGGDIVGIGNIKGQAYEMIEFFEGGEGK
ncbi:MAG: poly-gamma-glutamate synthase PgsB [Oscillospiraceae bacterium]|nr:poly-gamma-glutamate synthase PgsB [Oscillospiraceae bacterium]